ncbi:MAG: YlxM family DNA-binding protein [Acutalibacteraceae bacterium]
MSAKNFEITELLDIYGGLLTSKQLEMAQMYYDEDLSLGEISENEGVTRQAARDAIKKAEAKLFELEEKLHLLRDGAARSAAVGEIRQMCQRGELSPERVLELLDQLE